MRERQEHEQVDRHDGAEPPASAPIPPVGVMLPDRQEITALLHGWTQTRHGAWFCDVEITAWTLTRLPDREIAEPAPIRFAVPAHRVTPVPDTSYEGVSLRRHPDAVRRLRSPRRAPGPPTAPSEPDPPPEAEWQLHTLGGDPPRRSLHHGDCWIPKSGTPLTAAQARTAAAQKDIAADCTICHVAQRLPAIGR
ncbi:DUF6233 domain-containing protein [Streptomyces sp. H39-C1]|uniref:DUF6233 domain-containing protein n=1 Tax=Streptomyces sp. H39-C1 TaxID=3004355 RepID=UPI0022AED14E|nr:DUF6233 domain-containing protein [Streptomyces sp. H39-C1]MCZ4102535.1 DUF6233 domain-containing protein [Streptomyces sp. H39-C1]